MYYWHWIQNLLSKPQTTGYPTKSDPEVALMAKEVGASRVEPRTLERLSIRRSCAIRHLDAGSCNGCESELSLLPSPAYDFSRYGFGYTAVPKHADLLVITGVITRPMASVIEQTYAQMGVPKRVVVIGECAISGGWFRESPDVLASLEGIVAVTAKVEGCPPAPPDILRGLFLALDGQVPTPNN